MSEVTELSANLVKSSDVIGVTVKNLKKEKLGKVEEIILDKLTGQTAYVVLSFGGFLGLGDKLFAMPWKIFNYDPDEEAFIINIDKERLKAAPGFDKDKWPDLSDSTYITTIKKFYGTRSTL